MTSLRKAYHDVPPIAPISLVQRQTILAKKPGILTRIVIPCFPWLWKSEYVWITQIQTTFNQDGFLSPGLRSVGWACHPESDLHWRRLLMSSLILQCCQRKVRRVSGVRDTKTERDWQGRPFLAEPLETQITQSVVNAYPDSISCTLAVNQCTPISSKHSDLQPYHYRQQRFAEDHCGKNRRLMRDECSDSTLVEKRSLLASSLSQKMQSPKPNRSAAQRHKPQQRLKT